MRRSVPLVVLAALALTMGLSSVASAANAGGASVSVKKKAKGCKKGKGQKSKGQKGKRSASTSAKQAKGCKKAKGKRKAKGKMTPPVATLDDGTYEDAAASVQLIVSGGATSAVLKYSPPGLCVAIVYTSQPAALTKHGRAWTASESGAVTIAGQSGGVKWDLMVSEGLTYALNFTLEATTPFGPCKGEGHPTGALTKVG